MIPQVPRPSAASPFRVAKELEWQDAELLSDPHDKIRYDVTFCKEVVERIGLGFELPSRMPFLDEWTDNQIRAWRWL